MDLPVGTPRRGPWCPSDGRLVRPVRPVSVAASAFALTLAVGLAGCTGYGPQPDPTRPASSDSAGPSASAAPSTTATPAPTLDPAGSAKANLGYFDRINEATLAAHPAPSAQDFVDGLIAAGFERSAMLVTADRTSIDLTPGSIQFSVLLNGSCLIGQWGKSADGYHGEAATVLSTGNCLIGGAHTP